MEMNQYLDLFLDESREHLQNMNQSLLLLEENPNELSIINDIFRAAHTLKGMSATMGYDDMTHLTHELENIFDLIREEKSTTTPDLIDIIFEAIDHLEAMIQDIAQQGSGKRDVSFTLAKLKQIEVQAHQTDYSIDTPTPHSTYEPTSYNEYEQTVLCQSIDQGYQVCEVRVNLREDCILKAARVYMIFEVLEQAGEIVKTAPSVEELENGAFGQNFQVTVITQIAESELTARFLKVSEVEAVELYLLNREQIALSKNKENPMSSHPAGEKQSVPPANEPSNVDKGSGNSSKTIRVNIDRLDRLMNLFEELVIDRGRLDELSKELDVPDLTDTVERMFRVSSELQNLILNLRMVPIDQVFNRFPRMVRSLSKELYKKIKLDMYGSETELDRTVIDEIGDPLVHILRNSMDHGIETPEERVNVGKKEEGVITLRAYHSGNHVFIEVSDDGAGIDRKKIMEKAISKGLFTNNSQETTDQELFQLLFSPGFSTAETISDISGRGVGLDVVRSKIESLGGNVIVESEKGMGTTFIIQLPLTLSIISVMLVKVKREKFAIPLSSILETAIISQEDILYTHHQPVIRLRDHVVPLIFLEKVLNVPGNREEHKDLSLVIVKKGTKMAALVVDTFIGQQEIVIKPLRSILNEVFAISGATILGNGQVALILDSNALIK